MKRTICILLTLLTAFVCSAGGNISLRKVVIDAGHGGHDPGAVSKDQKTYEKNLTLDISRRLGSLISESYPDIKVILTRDTDKFVQLTDRANIANRNDADLFISIHINSCKSTTPSGCSVHILGQSSRSDRDLFEYNMDVCKTENSVVLLEDDYSTTYQGFDPEDPQSYIFMLLMQNAYLEQSMVFAQMVANSLESGPIGKSRGVWQDPFLVLWRTSMPAVLVELGFISNSDDLAVLRNPDKRQELAQSVFNAFVKYKNQYDSSVQIESVPAAGSAAEPVKEVKTDSTQTAPVQPELPQLQYGIQIFATSSLLMPSDKRLLGYKPLVIPAGKVYKYIIGVENSLSGAKENFEKIRKNYPDSFLVSIEGESVKIL